MLSYFSSTVLLSYNDLNKIIDQDKSAIRSSRYYMKRSYPTNNIRESTQKKTAYLYILCWMYWYMEGESGTSNVTTAEFCIENTLWPQKPTTKPYSLK